MEAKRKAQLAAVERLKKKGVTAIKVELEAELNRDSHRVDDDDQSCPDCTYGRVNCDTCDGDAEVQCTTCEGYGTTTVDGAEVVCGFCEGEGLVACSDECDDGYFDCSTCDGEGVIAPDTTDTNWHSESVCANWLLQRIAAKTGESFSGDDEEYQFTDPFPWMSYAYFYEDGSVDSELTFTIRLDDPTVIFKLPLILDAWNEMAAEMGEDVDVRGAGMHMALLWDKDARYPSSADDYTREHDSMSNRLPEAQLTNFKRSMTQLLPALYFLGTGSTRSRGLGYRLPKISVDYRRDSQHGNPKYSAIVYKQGAMEFRLFDTCYDQPTIILDNIVVIANTMKYLSTDYRDPTIARKLGIDSLSFGRDSGDTIERFYSHITHLEALNIGLERLKPSYQTIRAIKEARGFTKTRRQLSRVAEERRLQAEREYAEYLERFEWELKAREHEARASYLLDLSKYSSVTDLKAMTPEQTETTLTAKVAAYVKLYQGRKKSATDYIKDRMKRLEEGERGIYTLDLR